MKAELYFGLRMKYLRTEYEPLMILTIVKPIYECPNYLWIFKYSDIKEVEAIVGTIEIPGFREGFHKEKIELPKWKGKDIVEILTFPKIYQIIEHRKQEDGSVKELRHNLDRTIVERVWKGVISKQLLNKPVKTSTVAEKICKELGITRFDRGSGSFDFAKFFGERTSYYRYFYLPVKVLQYQAKVIHYKDGRVARIEQ